MSQPRNVARYRKRLADLVIGIKGGGDLASGIAWRLYRSRFRHLWMMETARPLAVRRRVSFCEAVYEGRQTVEGVDAVLVNDREGICRAWQEQRLALRVDPNWRSIAEMKPDVVIDAILAKRNLGTTVDQAPLVIGLGPGFEAGRDVHAVIETNRGHHLGRVLYWGPAEADTRIPGTIAGFSVERIFRAPVDGWFVSGCDIGDRIAKDAVVGRVDDVPVCTQIGGVIRGLIRSSTPVHAGMKLGDVDPRSETAYCSRISDKSIAMGGAVLEAILNAFNH